MHKYNTVLASEYDSNTINFGVIQAEKEIKGGEVLFLNDKSYIVEEIMEDADLELELLVLNPIEIHDNLVILGDLILEN